MPLDATSPVLMPCDVSIPPDTEAAWRHENALLSPLVIPSLNRSPRTTPATRLDYSVYSVPARSDRIEDIEPRSRKLPRDCCTKLDLASLSTVPYDTRFSGG